MSGVVPGAYTVQAQSIRLFATCRSDSHGIMLGVRCSRGKGEGVDRDDILTVRDGLVHASSSPSEVGSPLASTRDTLLLVDVASQTTVGVKVVVKAVGRGGVAKRHQILERRHLELRAGKQESGMPGKMTPLFEKVELEVVLDSLTRLAQGDGEGKMGRAIANA